MYITERFITMWIVVSELSSPYFDTMDIRFSLSGTLRRKTSVIDTCLDWQHLTTDWLTHMYIALSYGRCKVSDICQDTQLETGTILDKPDLRTLKKTKTQSRNAGSMLTCTQQTDFDPNPPRSSLQFSVLPTNSDWLLIHEITKVVFILRETWMCEPHFKEIDPHTQRTSHSKSEWFIVWEPWTTVDNFCGIPSGRCKSHFPEKWKRPSADGTTGQIRGWQMSLGFIQRISWWCHAKPVRRFEI